MSTVFDITAPEFWEDSSDPYRLSYRDGGWRAEFFMDDTPLMPRRTAYIQDPYTYEYVVYGEPGHSFWDLYAEAAILSIRAEGVNRWPGSEEDNQPIYMNLVFRYGFPSGTTERTPSYNLFVLGETVLLPDLIGIDFSGIYGTEYYYSLNGITSLQIELDLTTAYRWRNHRRVTETIE